MTGRRERKFTAEEASAAAHEVVHHDPTQHRKVDYLPADAHAAAAGVEGLADELHGLAATFRYALQGAGDNAAHLSDDRLQGIAELIQNAEDLGATTASITVDVERSRLLFQHDGAGLTLHDVWGLTVPWLSLKATDAEKHGRFGVGLKTLQALSPVLEVHQGQFHVRFEANDLAVAADRRLWPTASPGVTTFIVPFEAGVVNHRDVTDWLESWGDAGLVFLKSIHTVELKHKGTTEIRLHVDRGPKIPLESSPGTVRQSVVSADGRKWSTYSQSVLVPADAHRARKAQTRTTPIALAFPQFPGDRGHLHVGLPVRPIGLPFRLLAQFDPLANRRDIADTTFNRWLFEPLSKLWCEAVLNLFADDPQLAWQQIPLRDEFDADKRTNGKMRTILNEHLLDRARRNLTERLKLSDGVPRPLSDLAYEAPELTGVLTADDIMLAAGTVGTLHADLRDADQRWRVVISELGDLGAKVPVELGVAEALSLLEDTSRPARFVADLTGIGVSAKATERLWDVPCLVLANQEHVQPNSVRGLRVILADGADDLWGTLGLGTRLADEYLASSGWPTIRTWLIAEKLMRTDVFAQDALEVLADAGNGRQPLRLSDEQLVAVRDAFEGLPPETRTGFGRGIGRSIELEAFTHDAEGKRIRRHARPADAYIVERDVSAWFVAAGATPELVWLSRRYFDLLTAGRSREGVGAQQLFGILGAERAPRLTPHPHGDTKYAGQPPGVSRHLTSSPKRREAQLASHSADYTVADKFSRDLDAVLHHIASVAGKDAEGIRLRRSVALLNTLNRAWERLEPKRVMAASAYYTWNYRGTVDAWWLASAASIPWLTAADGSLAAPDDLRVRTPGTIAIFGDNPSQFVTDELVASGHATVLAALGVRGDPRPGELLDGLREIREDADVDSRMAGDLAAPMYKALAAQIPPDGSWARGIGDVSAGALRRAFAEGKGLIATTLGWRRPSVVLSGPAIFEDLAPFVPAVTGTERLWEILGIKAPSGDDAVDILRSLSKTQSLSKQHRLAMLEALRVLARESSNRSLQRSSVWVGDRWTSKRPVYVVDNPLLAESLSAFIPVWAPGGALTQFESLIDRYRLTRIDAFRAHVVRPGTATYEPRLTAVFATAAAILREDLVKSDPVSEQSLTVPWGDLQSFRVCTLPGLTVEIRAGEAGPMLRFNPDAWLDSASSTLYLSHDDNAGKPGAGAYAVASAFTGDVRRISHDWVVAWARAEEGVRAEEVSSAASREAQSKRLRDEKDAQQLEELAHRPKARPDKARLAGAEEVAAGPSTSTRVSRAVPRTLVDLGSFTLVDERGELLSSSASLGPSGADAKGGRRSRGLAEPDRSRPKKKRPGVGAKNYTAEELESKGLELAKWVLGLDDGRVVDIRNQHNVGADAIDDLQNFYELKAYAGPIPDVVQLQDSQVARALSTDNFFLVVVGNLEEGSGVPEARVIVSPLRELRAQPSGAVKLGGVLAAKGIRYTFEQR